MTKFCDNDFYRSLTGLKLESTQTEISGSRMTFLIYSVFTGPEPCVCDRGVCGTYLSVSLLQKRKSFSVQENSETTFERSFYKYPVTVRSSKCLGASGRPHRTTCTWSHLSGTLLPTLPRSFPTSFRTTRLMSRVWPFLFLRGCE